MRAAPGPCARVLALGLALGAGCKTPSSSGGDVGSTPSTPDASSEVLARVGDRSITLGDYLAALEHMDQFDRMRYAAPERRRELLGEMIDVMLLADEARAKGYDKEPLTQQEIREVLRDAMLRRARAGAPAPADIPATDVRAYYDAHREDFRDPERRRISAVVTASEAVAAGVLDAAGRATAAQWGELVRAKSTEPEATPQPPVDLAGDLGFITPPGAPAASTAALGAGARGVNVRVPDEVRAAAFEIAKVGDVLPRVVKGGLKYYVVKLTSRSEARERTFEDAERTIRVKLAQEAIAAREGALLDELRKKYPVQVDPAALGQVRVDLAAGTAAP
ncbi:MAG TPA: peptidylprolyl isomerase [Polyangiaceae bacterium]|nr:peptidylprolyl isomerase [Polyangiaceae bacterium]